METVSERITALFEEWEKRQRFIPSARGKRAIFIFSVETRIEKQTLNAWMSGNRTPTDMDMLGRLSDECDSSIDWIMRGVGDPGPLLIKAAKLAGRDSE